MATHAPTNLRAASHNERSGIASSIVGAALRGAVITFLRLIRAPPPARARGEASLVLPHSWPDARARACSLIAPEADTRAAAAMRL